MGLSLISGFHKVGEWGVVSEPHWSVHTQGAGLKVGASSYEEEVPSVWLVARGPSSGSGPVLTLRGTMCQEVLCSGFMACRVGSYALAWCPG